MSYKIINGTSAADDISTGDLNRAYPGYDGFEVYGLSGDDSLNSSFIGRNGVDLIDGGDGDDFMSLFAPYRTPLSTITNYAVFNGGFGTDDVYVPLYDGEGYSNFRLDDGFIEFSVYGEYGEEVVVSVSPTVETISLGDLNYLTEDITNGRIRAVGWDELYARTYNENADWYIKGLDTYTEYHSQPEPAPEPGTPVHRLYNSSQGKHLFSSNEYEIDLLTGGGAWQDEGVIYNAPETATADVFRFYIPSEGRHFYTALDSERDFIIGNQETFSGWQYEGAAFSAYSTSDYPDDAVAVVRYLNQETGSHVYSTSAYEQSLLDQNSNWMNEGIAWFGDPMVVA